MASEPHQALQPIHFVEVKQEPSDPDSSSVEVDQFYPSTLQSDEGKLPPSEYSPSSNSAQADTKRYERSEEEISMCEEPQAGSKCQSQVETHYVNQSSDTSRPPCKIATRHCLKQRLRLDTSDKQRKGRKSKKSLVLAKHRRTHSGKNPLDCVIGEEKYCEKNSVGLLMPEQLKDKVKEFHCDLCQSSFVIKRQLIVHIRSHSGEKPPKAKYTKKPIQTKRKPSHSGSGDKQFVCNFCDARFSKNYHLAQHKSRTHYVKKRYDCDLCDAKYASKSHLADHKRKHSGDRPFVCDLCDARFARSSNLVQHKRIHSAEKPFGCNLCDAKFFRSSDLAQHKRIHSGDKPFVCKLCDARFTQSCHLAQHKRTHSGDKRYVCDVCGVRFCAKGNLTRHKTSHSEDKPFACNLCDAKFSLRDYLTRHILTHSGVKPFACDLCDAKFTQSSSLTTHKRIHSGDKPFACDLCDARFARRHYLTQHKIIHSGNL